MVCRFMVKPLTGKEGPSWSPPTLTVSVPNAYARKVIHVALNASTWMSCRKTSVYGSQSRPAVDAVTAVAAVVSLRPWAAIIASAVRHHPFRNQARTGERTQSR